jgi:hypothetical protein
MAANNIISLTVKSTSTAIKLNEGDIILLVGVSSNADSAVRYVSDNRTVKEVVFDETPTAIKALAPSLMDVTDTKSGSTITINASRVRFAIANAAGGCNVTLNEEGASWNRFAVDETVTAIQTAVNAASAGEFVETTGNQTIAGTKTFSSPILATPAVGLTAFATGGQASATALTASYNEVSTCATAGDSVKLPTAVAGYAITVKNNGAAALDIFPNTSDSIDGLAADLAVRIQPNSTATFRSNNATVWESTVDDSLTLNAPTTVSGQLEIKAADSAGNTVTTITNASQAAARTYTIPDAGASANFVMSEGAATINGSKTFGSPVIYNNATGITAFATGGQASATALTAENNNVTTVATAGDSVKLPAAAAGLKITVKNSGAAALDIFPASSDSIDALAADLAVRIQPGSVATFSAIDATVWESSVDASVTLVAPTTNTGQLEIKAADSAGNTVTTITNASQAAARTYTIPDAGASANFVMSEGAASINGAKTFSTAVTVPDGVVGTPGVKTTTTGHGIYEVSTTQMGLSVAGALATVADTSGLMSDSLRARVEPGTAGTNVTASTYGDGRNFTTVLTLASVSYTIAAGAAEGVSSLVYTFPAGAHLHEVSRMSVAATGGGTVDADTPDVGIGSAAATGAISVLSGTPTFEDYITGQTATDCSGTATVAMTAATAGYGTGISLNAAGDAKTVYLNFADTWAGADTFTVSGTITLKWTVMS